MFFPSSPSSLQILLQLTFKVQPECPLLKYTCPLLPRQKGSFPLWKPFCISGLSTLNYSHLCTSYRESDFQSGFSEQIVSEPPRQCDTKSEPRHRKLGARGGRGVPREAGCLGHWMPGDSNTRQGPLATCSAFCPRARGRGCRLVDAEFDLGTKRVQCG